MVEHITGDEQAFQRDLQPATDAERAATLAILTATRDETLTLMTSSGLPPPAEDPPAMPLPNSACSRLPEQALRLMGSL